MSGHEEEFRLLPAERIEEHCAALLAAAGLPVPDGKSARLTVTNFVAEAFPEGSWDDLVEEHGSGAGAWDFLNSEIGNMISGKLFSDPVLHVYRGLRVTCPPEDVRVTGTAADIGCSWSLSETVESPDFLGQYGEPGGRDVFLEADVEHDGVNWLLTFWKQQDPWITDYNEVVLKPEAVPGVTSVRDPDAPQAAAGMGA